MIFFAYLIVLGLYLLLVFMALVYVPSRIKDKRQRLKAFLTALTIFVLVPAAWILYERLYFDWLCANQARVEIFRKVEGAEGFIGSGGSAAEMLKAMPFKYIEDEHSDGGFVRFSLTKEGKLNKERVKAPLSNYARRSEFTDIGIADVTKFQSFIVDYKTGEVVAVKTSFSQGGNWFKPWLGTRYCSSQSREAGYEFIVRALNPSRIGK